MHRIPLLQSFRSGKMHPRLLQENQKDYQSIHYVDRDRSSTLELEALLGFTFPLLITFLMAYGIRIMDVWFLGKLGSEVMAIVSLGGLFTTVTGLALGSGILSAIDTLVAQAFTGSNNPHTIGVILQRGILIVTLFAIPVCCIWLNAESILIYMGQDPTLSHKTQAYIYRYIPVLFLMFIITALRKCLQGTKQMQAIMYTILLTFPLSIVANYLFLIYWDLGYLGAAYYSVAFNVFFLLFYLIYIHKMTDFKEKYWPKWSRKCLHGWDIFLKLGIPGMMSVSTDWAFEVCAMATGVLSEASLAAQSVVLVVNGFLLQFPWALGTALIVRLGHHLGANEPKKTKRCVIIATLLVLGCAFINASLMFVFRTTIASYFTTEHEVLASIDALMRIASLCQFVTGFGIIFSCTLNAFGRQSTVACFNLVSYYLIGLPFGLFMTMHYNWGLVGVWAGVALAGFLKAVGEGLVILLTIDWVHECRMSAKRIDTQESTLVR